MKHLSKYQEFLMACRFIKNYNKVCHFPHLSQEKITDYQFKKIKELLSIAYYHTKFYRNKYDSIGIRPEDVNSFEDFKYIPTITKEELITHNLDFIDDRLNKTNLIRSRSSGSSGKFVDLYFSEGMYIDEEIQVIRMLKEFDNNYSFFDNEVLVYTSEYPVTSILGGYKVFYVNNLLPIDTIADTIRKHNPKVIAIYPSILRELAINNKIDLSNVGISTIITNSEYSSQTERDELEKILGCQIFDEFSSEELQSVFCQCKHKRYHDIPDCTYIELLQPESDIQVATGMLGEIVGTCLINYAMPIIRYRSGDYASESLDICSCGKNTRVFDNIEGRRNSSIIKPNGTIIPSGKLLDWTYSMVLQYNLPISEFQIVQEDLDNIIIKLVVKKGIVVDFVKKIKESYIGIFGNDFNVNVDIVDSIPKTSAGKHIPIVSKVLHT